jgi:CRISPR-associated endonuclease/helicase Cas3
MQFYSHSKKDEYGSVRGSKLLTTHIDGVLNKALLRLNKGIDFGTKENDLDLAECLTLIIKLHDLGKYTTFFQNYLLNTGPIDQTLKQHARIGGLVAYNLLKERNEKAALLAL